MLAFFPSEDAADEAAKALKQWEKATEYMKLDAVGVLARTATATSRSTSSAGEPGSAAWASASRWAWSLRSPRAASRWSEGVLGGGAGGVAIGEFFHKGLKMSEEDAARISQELDAGHAAVGVLAWDSETEAVADNLKELGGNPQSHEVAEVPAAAV